MFSSQTCFDNHITNHVCHKYAACETCGKVYRRRTRHVCGQTFCKHCDSFQLPGHLCYMHPVENKKKGKDVKYIIYDFESMLTPEGKHIPNLCVAHTVCAKCFSTPMIGEGDPCTCGRRRDIFSGKDTLTLFGDWVFNNKRKNTICIAHNSKGYDAHFLVDYLHSRAIKPTLIQTGRKIMCLSVGSVKCIDSLNFLPMPLSKLPVTFGLNELSKGFFPHLFNTIPNQNYTGPIPSSEYYDPEGMSSDNRKVFYTWYTEHIHDRFNLQQELLKYCISDVDILQRACGMFRDTFVKVTADIEPFERAITIASACNLVYRTLFLQKDQIALIPPHGYYQGNQSSIALTWLHLESIRIGQVIQHGGNQGEALVEGYRVSRK